MACFSVPLAGAVAAAVVHKSASEKKNPFIARLPWLVKMTLGGSFLLAIEHIYHGEISFAPPFLTAMSNPADTAAMLHEMATAGVAMALLLVAVWSAMVVVSTLLERRSAVNV